ncbi:MAG: VOC family protein [Fimbriimonadaceae bacterium]|nr:VOC family protein [Fimbriimonadaceae bacterium]
MITAWDTTWCPVTEMDRAVAFYRDVLGLTPAVQSPFWSDFQLGDHRIGLHPAHDLSRPTGPMGGWRLGLATDDLRALRRKLEAAGATILDDYHETPSGVVLTFADPDGNPIQAIQRGSRRADFQE